jgi:hypothetical protein
VLALGVLILVPPEANKSLLRWRFKFTVNIKRIIMYILGHNDVLSSFVEGFSFLPCVLIVTSRPLIADLPLLQLQLLQLRIILA